MPQKYENWRTCFYRSNPYCQKIFPKKYNRNNGWYVNWDELLDENEVYALVVEGSVDIQGLVAVAKNDDMKAAYICWMCSNPQNNRKLTDDIKYAGVGGHLFVICAKKSIDYGFNGLMCGFAANKDLLEHYMKVFNCEHIGILHPFQFAIDEENAQKILEGYTYEWTDEQI